MGFGQLRAFKSAFVSLHFINKIHIWKRWHSTSSTKDHIRKGKLVDWPRTFKVMRPPESPLASVKCYNGGGLSLHPLPGIPMSTRQLLILVITKKWRYFHTLFRPILPLWTLLKQELRIGFQCSVVAFLPQPFSLYDPQLAIAHLFEFQITSVTL